MATQHASEPIERSVQLAGNSTFVVSLPKAWAVERGLERGVPIYLYPRRDRVIVAPATLDPETRTATVDVGALGADGHDQPTADVSDADGPDATPSAAVSRRVYAAYAAGADRIVVTDATGIDPAVASAVRSTAARLLGAAVREETADRIVVDDLLDRDEVSLAQTVAQCRGTALDLHADAVEAVLEADGTLAETVAGRRPEVGRLVGFVSRGVSRGLGDVGDLGRLDVDRATAFDQYRTARALDRVAALAARIASVAQRQAGPPADPLREPLSTAATDARATLDLALDDDPDRAHRASERALSSITSFEDALREADDPDAHLYGAVAECLRRTATLGRDLAAVSTETRLLQ